MIGHYGENDNEHAYGLEGCVWYHGDLEGDDDVDLADKALLQDIIDACADFDDDGDIDLTDLTILLATYGLCDGDQGYNSECDIYGDDDCITIQDLAELLSVYGGLCGCDALEMMMMGLETTPIDNTITVIDTGGHTGGGFNDEVDHFVFDYKIQVNSAGDDWIAAGVDVDAANSATFRLSVGTTVADQYATFVSAPWTTLPVGSSGANVVGSYDPAGTSVFSTSDLNLAYCDTTDSLDGPATIMRLVIGVSNISGADVSSGFGSVYFSTTGKIGKDDILVATLSSITGTADTDGDMESLSGNFYVRGAVEKK